MSLSGIKRELIFIFPNCVGGVASFYRNIINYYPFKDRVFVRVLLLDPKEDRRPKFDDTIIADELQIFSYSTSENQYYVAKRLANEIDREGATIITDNSLPLNAANFFCKQPAIAFLVHDYFYVRWALQFRDRIDLAIVHSAFFRDILLAADVKTFLKKSIFLPYGVSLPDPTWSKAKNSGVLKLVFLGRLVEEKGLLLLRDIDFILQEKGIQVEWCIVGKGPLKNKLKQLWSGVSYVSFIEAGNSEEVLSILERQDILVFPSWFEGTPVAIMEAISRGVVPVVSDLPGGTRDMVNENVGFKCEIQKAYDYAEAIERLNSDRLLLSQFSDNCMNQSRLLYSVEKASIRYVEAFTNIESNTASRFSKKFVDFSRMDQRFFPNWATTSIRSIIKYLFRK